MEQTKRHSEASVLNCRLIVAISAIDVTRLKRVGDSEEFYLKSMIVVRVTCAPGWIGGDTLSNAELSSESGGGCTLFTVVSLF